MQLLQSMPQRDKISMFSLPFSKQLRVVPCPLAAYKAGTGPGQQQDSVSDVIYADPHGDCHFL